jgi:Icc-related predicted phosphoesterase
MRVQVLSDLHLEFGALEIDFDDVDLVIFAGDVNIGEKGLLWIKEKISRVPVLYVLGNHEYYRSSYPKLLSKLLQSSIGTNVHVLENSSVEIDGIRFHGTTLWTSFELFGDPKLVGPVCQQKMNDYKLIRLDPSYSKLRSIDTHLFHYRSLKWLKESLLNSNTKKNIVITHHAPSPRSLPIKYRDDIISAAYASDLEDFIKQTKPDLWIHGHVHEPFDYVIDKTRVICNPRGYIHDPYNGFNSKLVLEVSY